MNHLGDMYNLGFGVTKDPQQAMLWYRKAVASGNADAMRNVGSLYELGQGVGRDYGLTR